MAVAINVMLAAVVFCAITHTAGAGQCRYIDCVLEGTPARETEVEVFMSNLNLTRNSRGVALACAVLAERIARCDAEKANCSSTLNNTWEDRMQDPVYIDFLVWIGKNFCRHPQLLNDLRECFTEELRAAVQGCVRAGHNFNPSCIHDQYNSLENCPDSVDRFFRDIVEKYLTLNPYGIPDVQTKPTGSTP